MGNAPPEIANWLDAFPRDMVERNIAELEASLEAWRNALALHESMSGPKPKAEPTGHVPTKPQAIATILQQADHPLSPKEIRQGMIERGWLPDHAKASKRFYSTMSRLNSEDRITRLSDGRYVLPAGSQEALMPT